MEVWLPYNLPVIKFEAYPKQLLALKYLMDDTTTEILYGGGAGGAKSYLGVSWLIISAFKYNGTRWLMGRSTLKSLKETTLVTFFKAAADMGLKGDSSKNRQHYVYNQQSSVIKFFNGSEILLKDLYYYPSDPSFDSLGSLEIAGAFIDEVAQVTPKAKEIVKSRMGWKMPDGEEIKPKLLMSCNPNKGFSYREFYKPYTEGTLHRNKKFIPALWSDNPSLSQGRIDSLKNLTGIDYKRLTLGQWEYNSSEDALVNYDNIINIFNNRHIENRSNNVLLGTKTNDNIIMNERYITVDCARFGRDKTIIWLWHGLKAIKMFKLKQVDTKQASDFIKELSQKENVPINNIIIDDDGIGAGVVDNIRGCTRFVNGSSPLKHENFTNLKAQCYYKLADMINKNNIFIDVQFEDKDKDMLIEEIEQIRTKSVDTDGKKAIISKEEVKTQLGRSPDFSDALMFRMYPIVRQASNTFGFAVI